MAVFFRVHEAAVQSFIEPGGEVHDLIHDVAKDAKAFSVQFAPMRTGKLKRNIYVGQPKRVAIYGLSSTVAANVRYALWVHQGTRGPIRSKSGKKLKVVSFPSGGISFHKQVRGQTANPFLARGLRAAMARRLG